MSVLLVGLGAAVGAPARFLVDRAMKARLPGVFPWGTFAVNIAGSFVLGLIMALADPVWATLAGTGFCGALTTYSTFSYETVALIEGRHRLLGLTYLVASVVVGVAAAVLGWASGHLL